MNLKELIQRQQALLDTAKAAKRELTAEEQRELEDLQRQIAEAIKGVNPPTTPTAPIVPPTAPQMDEAAVREAERQRTTEIMALCRGFNVATEEMEKYIKENTTVDAVRAAIMDNIMKNGAPIVQGGSADLSVTKDAQDKFCRAAADALVMRSGMNIEKPADGARDLMGMSLRDLAIECLGNEGETNLNRRSSDELYTMLQRQFYNPTAAFPTMLDNAINKAYVEGHKTVAVTFDQFTKKGTLRDFKTHDNNYLSGPAGEFLEVPEGGELKHDVFSDKHLPTRKLKTYGRQFTLTRQAFINDDIDLVTRVPAKYAASARKTINKQVFEILVKNPAIYDGTALFSQAHGNLVTTGTGITQASMQTMILALQSQLDEFGDACIIRPAKIVVPAGMAFDIYTLFNSPTINTEGNTQSVNPLYRYANQIQVIEDPTINVLCGGFGNAMPWFLLGSADDTDFIEVDYLNGQEIPTIRRMETAGTLGFVWDIYLDWGISVMDYRGAIKNPGVVIKNPLA